MRYFGCVQSQSRLIIFGRVYDYEVLGPLGFRLYKVEGFGFGFWEVWVLPGFRAHRV